MTQIDWKADISRIGYWKQVAAEHDTAQALPWKLPRVGAKQDEIAEAERALGLMLPSEFREFLALANGWQGFHVLTDLFGTADIVQGRWQSVMERPEVKKFLVESGWQASEVIVIGASDFDLDVFLLLSDNAAVMPGGVVWFAGQEVDRYQSFHDFLAAMVNYNARIASKLAGPR